jgi:hypothetical protein
MFVIHFKTLFKLFLRTLIVPSPVVRLPLFIMLLNLPLQLTLFSVLWLPPNFEHIRSHFLGFLFESIDDVGSEESPCIDHHFGTLYCSLSRTFVNSEYAKIFHGLFLCFGLKIILIDHHQRSSVLTTIRRQSMIDGPSIGFDL